MAVADYATYKSRLAGPSNRCRFSKNAVATNLIGGAHSSWLVGGFPGAGTTPTTSVVCTAATTGAMPTWNVSSSIQRILRITLECGQLATGATGGLVTVSDRLTMSSGLSDTSTLTQTTNLPTAALTRYTNGVGVEAAYEIYTTVGTVATTISAGYTDVTNGGSRVAPLTTFGGTNYRTSQRFIPMPLQIGDVGVKSVENVTLTASTTGSGSYGITQHYPLVSLPFDMASTIGNEAEALFGLGCWFPRIVDNACLFFVVHLASTSSGVLQGTIDIAEDT